MKKDIEPYTMGKTFQSSVQKIKVGQMLEKKSKHEFLIQYGFQEIAFSKALTLLGVDTLFNDFCEEDEEELDAIYLEEEDENDTHIFYVKGDVYLDEDFRIPDVYLWSTLIIVDGNLIVNGAMGLHYYITGDASFYKLSMNNWQVCKGKEEVRFMQYQMAEDHEFLRKGRPRHVTAPYFFSWFYDLNSYTFDPKTSILALYDGEELQHYTTENPLLVWHEYAYVLKPEFFYPLQSLDYDGINWKISEIYKALQSNPSIFIDGFTIASIPYYNKGERLMAEKDYEHAFLHFKKSIALSPKFYLGYLKAGLCLQLVNAYAQAKLYFDQGVPLRPETITDPNDYCTFYSGLNAIRAGQYEEAISLANNALERYPDDPYFLRIKGEALLFKEDLVTAKKVLEIAVNKVRRFFPAYWLLGLIFYKEGKMQKAEELFSIAQDYYADAKPYSETQTLAYYYTSKTVDWTEKSLDA